MARARYIPGCNRTSRWFGDRYVGTAQGDVLEKLVLHSTETDKRWGCPGYQGGGTAPTVTINPWSGYRERWQHFTADRSARALLNPSSTPVSENKDRVAQAEIIGYSDPNLGKSRGCYLPDLDDEGLAYIAEVVRFYHEEYGVRLVRPATWPWYRVNNEAAFAAARMSSSQYDRFTGVLAHLHVSGNAHRDVAIDIDRLLRLAAGRAGSGGTSTPTSPIGAGSTPTPVLLTPWEQLMTDLNVKTEEDLIRVIRKAIYGTSASNPGKNVWDGSRIGPDSNKPASLLLNAARDAAATRALIEASATAGRPLTPDEVQEAASRGVKEALSEAASIEVVVKSDEEQA